MMPYTASKHAIIGITKTAGLSYSLGAFGYLALPLSLPASCRFGEEAV